MRYRRHLWLALCPLVFAILVVALPARAQVGTSPELASLLSRIAHDPSVPPKYTADVKLHVHLRVFPWISITLHGNEAYKHPGIYRFIFRGVPKAANRFSDLAYDLGDSSTWPARFDISLLGAQTSGADPVIRLLPKKRGLVKTLDVTIDQARGHILRAVWNRFDGGTITLVQHYETLGTHDFVSKQDAAINIPGMKADLVAEYSGFNF
ncbi:MAG: hypothetical protein M3M96_02390 [Candidatus Eremiobacteraeota bacterium]|nr:hypothetical protein [Candidatus Eremiobacteraeota bacterium]